MNTECANGIRAMKMNRLQSSNSRSYTPPVQCCVLRAVLENSRSKHSDIRYAMKSETPPTAVTQRSRLI